MQDRIAKRRQAYAGEIARRAGVKDPRIEAAFAAVPREDYAGPPPWRIGSGGVFGQTTDNDPARLYDDVLIAIDAKRGVNNGQPSLHAQSIDALGLKEGETILQIGAGAGYYTAILAHLVGPEGKVVAYEIDPGHRRTGEDEPRQLSPGRGPRPLGRRGLAQGGRDLRQRRCVAPAARPGSTRSRSAAGSSFRSRRRTRPGRCFSSPGRRRGIPGRRASSPALCSSPARARRIARSAASSTKRSAAAARDAYARFVSAANPAARTGSPATAGRCRPRCSRAPRTAALTRSSDRRPGLPTYRPSRSGHV